MTRTIKIIFLAILALSFASGMILAKQSLPIEITIDGKVSKKIELYLINKMGYLKARDVAEIFKASLNYDKSVKEVYLRWHSDKDHKNPIGEIKFVIGNEYVVMDGIKRKMMKKPQIIESRIYIPLEAVITRAFESIVGAQVNWSFSKKTLWISHIGNIADVRNYSYKNYSRFVVELTEDLNSNIKRNKDCLELTVRKGSLAMPLENMPVNDGVITGIDIKKNQDSIKFMVYTGANAGEYKIKKLPGPYRIVLDVENKQEKIKEKKSLDELPPVPAGPAKRDKVKIDDIKLVVIDPGHGGKDPGAIGQRGTKEKDITLKIAKKLAKKIRQNLKVRTILTRTQDVFVPLSKRTEIANSKNADIFISIHTNASLNPKSQGFEVYFLSGDSSDKEAQAVANMENSVMAMEDRTSEMNRVSRILWSLTMNQFMNESSELCSFINKSVIKRTELTGRGVKQAGFYVMRGARMPAVLVESAFLSNKKEEKILNKDGFQEKVADAICNAVSEYKSWIKGK
jgi:N-acetylmuramoyl-L-alanine amidase